MSKEIKDGLLKCPDCDDVGYYADYDRYGNCEQVQCMFCYCEPLSIFNSKNPIDQAKDNQ